MNPGSVRRVEGVSFARALAGALGVVSLAAACGSGDGGGGGSGGSGGTGGSGVGGCFDRCLQLGGDPASCSTVCGVAGSGGSSGTGGSAGTGQPANLAIGQQVPYPTSDWTVVAPEDMGMDSAVLDGARQYAFQADKNTQAVVVVRGGAIVAEWYNTVENKNRDSMAASWSMAKSFTSALVGIAIAEGRIQSVEQPLSTWLPEWAGDVRGTIPLRAVLQMQSGLAFQEDYNDLTSDIVRLANVRDTAQVVFGLRMHPSGVNGRWYYSSGDTQILALVLERATGTTPAAYARQKLLGPIGMNPADWWIDGAGHTYGYCCLDAPTRQFAKFGLLFLREGAWDGAQIVPAAWVKESVGTIASFFPGYAYQWWTSTGEGGLPPDLYSAQGLDSQRIYVIPSLDLVIAKNTLYSRANVTTPGVAENGWLGEFQPRFGYQNGTGTIGAAIWDDLPFLAPIINSIEGSNKLEAGGECVRGSPFDVGACSARLSTYAVSPQTVSCTCNECSGIFLDCDQNPGCAELLKCAFATGCAKVSAIDCATPCAEAINKFGGVDGCSVQLALLIAECAAGAAGGVGCL